MPHADPEAHRAYQAAYRAAHREKRLAQTAAWRAEHRDYLRAHNAAYAEAHQERRRSNNIAWRAAHREEQKAYKAARRDKDLALGAAYRAAHREKMRAYAVAHHAAHPQKAKERTHRRRARMARNGTHVIALRDQRRLERGPCAYCGGAGPFHWDHVIPIARGGRHAIGNLVTACVFCNLSKGTRLVVEWRLRA